MQRTVATIDLDGLDRNCARVRQTVRDGCGILAVVKADAYGHGAVPVARALARHPGVSLAVAFVEEGLTLRDAGVHTPILVLHEATEAQYVEAIRAAVRLTIYSQASLPDVSRAATKAGRPATVHLRIDTGIGPPGVRSDVAIPAIEEIERSAAVKLEAVYTQLSDPWDDEQTRQQVGRLERLFGELKRRHGARPLVHAASSGGILRSQTLHYDLVRPGALLYGRPRALSNGLPCEVEDILNWCTTVVDVRIAEAGERMGYGGLFITSRRGRVATIPVGYADGVWKRHADHRDVLIRGRRAPILGRATMDTCLIDVSAVPGANVGDEVVLVGQQGSQTIRAHDLASHLGVPLPEIWCAIGSRVPRTYVRKTALGVPDLPVRDRR